ncbi:MAG: hypothetical protein KAI43_09465 [Candidatus Aureabacteria bacterium]|nr:hypothetical protein [Candidatus Auribacterota bacterium]
MLNNNKNRHNILIDKKNKSFYLKSNVYDNNLKSPLGFINSESSKTLINKIKIINNGKEPVRRIIVNINKNTILNKKDLINKLRLNDSKERSVHLIYNYWINNRFHATSDIKENDNPFFVLNCLGYTICSNDSYSLSYLLSLFKIPSRRIPLIGHNVREYYFNNKWNIIDGDTNSRYFCLDNSKLASYKEIKENPFLALRTLYGGKYEKYNIIKSWKNMSLIKYGDDNKYVKEERKVVHVNFKYYDIYPGEEIVFYNNKFPEIAISKRDLRIWKCNVRKKALNRIEQIVNIKERIKDSNKIIINTLHPIYKIKNLSGDELELLEDKCILKNGQELIYHDCFRDKLELRTLSRDGYIKIYCQSSKASFPELNNENNFIDICHDNIKDHLIMSLYVDKKLLKKRKLSIQIGNRINKFIYKRPYFICKTESCNVDKIWWQISRDKDFVRILTNLDKVEKYRRRIKLSEIDNTFISNNKEYYFRVKAKKNGIWSNWSETFKFTVKKPSPVRNISVLRKDDKTFLKWNSEKNNNDEYVIFGSSNMDILPCIYSRNILNKIIQYDKIVSKISSNNNYVGKTKDNIYEVSENKYYMIITKCKGQYSVPSDIIKINSRKYGSILQSKHFYIMDSKFYNGFKDLYISERLALNGGKYLMDTLYGLSEMNIMNPLRQKNNVTANDLYRVIKNVRRNKYNKAYIWGDPEIPNITKMFAINGIEIDSFVLTKAKSALIDGKKVRSINRIDCKNSIIICGARRYSTAIEMELLCRKKGIKYYHLLNTCKLKKIMDILKRKNTFYFGDNIFTKYIDELDKGKKLDSKKIIFSDKNSVFKNDKIKSIKKNKYKLMLFGNDLRTNTKLFYELHEKIDLIDSDEKIMYSILPGKYSTIEEYFTTIIGAKNIHKNSYIKIQNDAINSIGKIYDIILRNIISKKSCFIASSKKTADGIIKISKSGLLTSSFSDKQDLSITDN